MQPLETLRTNSLIEVKCGLLKGTAYDNPRIPADNPQESSDTFVSSFAQNCTVIHITASHYISLHSAL